MRYIPVVNVNRGLNAIGSGENTSAEHAFEKDTSSSEAEIHSSTTKGNCRTLVGRFVLYLRFRALLINVNVNNKGFLRSAIQNALQSNCFFLLANCNLICYISNVSIERAELS